ncbi:hypothetical protein Glove_487g8 [Diversispora epigaea]|uniref:Protein kinase domain-containing protein n=1 Tax=Diversispora epigaea TaxID=1348612 RepID=A0A397GIZ4_9GLOM|nr:hypothetical protein Glove_487g8 [Diversispora epigaea]
MSMFEPDDYRTCHNCDEVSIIDIRKLCEQCYMSGNKNIDNFITDTQLPGLILFLKEYYKIIKPKSQPYPYLVWVHLINFQILNILQKADLVKIFKATWNLNGQKKEHCFKILNYSKNADTKFLNEKIIHCDLHSGNILVITNDDVFEVVISDLEFSQQSDIKKHYPDKYWLEFQKAEKKRKEMIKFKKSFVNKPGYEHPESRYFSILLDLESISTITSSSDQNSELGLSDQPSIDNFDIMNSK